AHQKLVEHVTIRAVTFSHTEWHLPDPRPPATQPAREGEAPAEPPFPTDSGGFAQAAIPVPAVIRGDGVRNCTFDRCTIAHAGTWGIELSRACSQNHITRCTLTDLGAGGIKLGEDAIRQKTADLTFANEIADCTISDAGHVFPSAVGIWLGQTFDNR